MKPTQYTNGLLKGLFLALTLLALTLPAYADSPDAGAQQKDKNLSHSEKGNMERSQHPVQSPQIVRHEAPRQVQQVNRTQNHQQPIHQQPAHQQPVHQQAPQARPVQEDHRGQWADHNKESLHDRILDRIYVPFPVISYVNVAPVQDNGYNDAGNLAFGTFVSSLPSDYLKIYINDQLYAYYQGVFYKQTFSGFEVIDPGTLVSSGSFALGIYNNSGKFVQIQFNAVNNGYVGPQGEFYPQFPQISQLQMMYL